MNEPRLHSQFKCPLLVEGTVSVPGSVFTPPVQRAEGSREKDGQRLRALGEDPWAPIAGPPPRRSIHAPRSSERAPVKYQQGLCPTSPLPGLGSDSTRTRFYTRGLEPGAGGPGTQAGSSPPLLGFIASVWNPALPTDDFMYQFDWARPEI